MENVVRVGRGGWREEEISQLRDAVRRAGGDGEPLRGVFERIGERLGRKPNSVRNYYYACLKREEADNVPTPRPFKPLRAKRCISSYMMSWPRGQKGFPCVHACSRWRAETAKTCCAIKTNTAAF